MTTQTLTRNETEVRELLDRYSRAVEAKDPQAVRQCFAADKFRAFDLLPPLEYGDFDEYMSLWQMCFESMKGPMQYEYKELCVQADEDVAFASGLIRMAGDMGEGKVSETYIRSTLGLRKFDGQWRIMHEHTSYPTDMESGKALGQLKPGEAYDMKK